MLSVNSIIVPRPQCIRIFLNPQLFLCVFGFRPHVSSESGKRIRNLFLSVLRGGNFWIRYESGIVWTLNPEMFLSNDITISSPVLPLIFICKHNVFASLLLHCQKYLIHLWEPESNKNKILYPSKMCFRPHVLHRNFYENGYLNVLICRTQLTNENLWKTPLIFTFLNGDNSQKRTRAQSWES